jgi:hypothetical protein
MDGLKVHERRVYTDLYTVFALTGCVHARMFITTLRR